MVIKTPRRGVRGGDHPQAIMPLYHLETEASGSNLGNCLETRRVSEQPTSSIGNPKRQRGTHVSQKRDLALVVSQSNSSNVCNDRSLIV